MSQLQIEQEKLWDKLQDVINESIEVVEADGNFPTKIEAASKIEPAVQTKYCEFEKKDKLKHNRSTGKELNDALLGGNVHFTCY